MLSYGATVLLTLTQISIWFLLLFVLLPQGLFPTKHSKPWSYHLLDHIVRMSFVSIILVHLLAFLNIFDVIALIVAWLLLYLAYHAWVRQAPLLTQASDLWKAVTIYFFDLLDEQAFLKTHLKEAAGRAWRNLLGALPQGQEVWWALALWVILLISGYLRLFEAVRGPAPASADTYLHLLWFKGLGISRLYPDGLYPYGSYALLQVIQRFTLIDGTLMMRLIPGLVGVLLTVTIYWSVKRLTDRRSPALLAAALYGIFGFARWLPLPLPPQGDVLTVEMALIFFLPALVFLTEALAGALKPAPATAPSDPPAVEETAAETAPDTAANEPPSPSPTFLFFQSMACLFFIQPFVGILGLIALVIALLVVTLLNLRSKKAVRLLNLGFGAALVGLAPLLIGLAQGISLHLGPLRWDVHFFGASLRQANFLPEPPPTPAVTPLFYLGLAGALLLILLSVRATETPTRLRLGWQVFGGALLILSILFIPQRLGLNELLLPGQVARALALVLSVVIGLSLHQLWLVSATIAARLNHRVSQPWPQYLELSLTVSVLLILLIPFPSVLIPSPSLAVTSLPKEEYDSVTAQIFRIKAEIPTYQWTAVAYPEALPQAFGDGFSIANQDFLDSYRPETWQFDPRRPELAIPSPHVFIFIEKQPYIVPGTSAEEALARDLTRERLQDWVERYQALHDDMSLFYEDGVLAIYHIYRTPAEEERILTAIETGQMPIGIAPPAPLTQQEEDDEADQPAEDAPPTPTVIPTTTITYQVQRGEVINLLEFEGQIAPVTQRSLFFQTSGRISATHLAEGESAAKGQILVELETDSLKRALASAQASLGETTATASDSPTDTAARQAALELEIAHLNLAASRRAQSDGPAPTETAQARERAYLAFQTAENNFNDVQKALGTPVGQNEELKRIWNDPWVGTVSERGTALEEATENYLKDQLFREQAERDLARYENEVAVAQRRVALAQLRVDEAAAGPSPALQQAVERAEANVERLTADVAEAEQAVDAAAQDPDTLATQYDRLRDLERQLAEAELELRRASAEMTASGSSQSAEAQQAEIDLWVAMIELEQLQDRKPDLEFALLQAQRSEERSEGVLRQAEDKYFQVTNEGGTQPPELLALHQTKMAYIRADVAHQRAGNNVSEHEIMLREHEVEQAQLNAAQTEAETPAFDYGREQTRLEIERLEQEIATAQLIAPIDGAILSMSLTPGQFVDAFRPVAIMADLNELEVRADQVTFEMQQFLEKDMPATITPLTGAEPTETGGSIRQVPTAAPTPTTSAEVEQTAQLPVRVALDVPADEAGYRLGDRVRVRVEVERKEAALWLPPQAIATDPNGIPYVFVKVDGTEDKEDRVQVELGLQTQEQVEILSGLEAGQTVVVK